MSQYHKINTIFKRDEKTRRLLVGEWSQPEFAYLANNEWHFTEKVDGTNIRIVVDGDGSFVIGGRTDNAQIPAALVARINERLLPQRDRLREEFPNGSVLYGEGYGAGIQAAGKHYRDDQDFILFDVRVGGWWLNRGSVVDIALRFSLDVVPCVGAGDLYDAMRIVALGSESELGSLQSEGIVARPSTELLDRGGRRIIAKIKTRDFALKVPA